MSLNIIDTLNPLGSFPVAKAADISVGNKRLDVALAEKVNAEPGKSLISQGEKAQIADATNSTKNLAIPYALNSTNAGVTLSRDEEYRVIATGIAGATVRFIATQVELAAGSYIVSGCTDGSGSTYRLRIGSGAGNEYVDAVTTTHLQRHSSIKQGVSCDDKKGEHYRLGICRACVLPVEAHKTDVADYA